MPIHFTGTTGTYGCFSNLSYHPFVLQGKMWATVEHYLQAQKFAGTEYEEEIRVVESPMKAMLMGRDPSRPLRADWEQVQDEVVRQAVLQKFQMNEDILDVLLATGDEEIVYKTTGDHYWGCGTDGSGQNRLGQILMETRTRLR